MPVRLIDRRKRFDNPALGDRAATALIDQAIQFGLERLKITYLSFDFAALLARNRINRSARLGYDHLQASKARAPDPAKRLNLEPVG
jgi:hypothetical protein